MMKLIERIFGHRHKWELDSLSSSMLNLGLLYPNDLWYYEGYKQCECGKKEYFKPQLEEK
jgi:hypothetical protein